MCARRFSQAELLRGVSRLVEKGSDLMAQVIRSPKTYDVIVVGSGAGGGMAAKILTEGGLNVVLLEAGPQVHPEKDFKMLTWPYELAHRGAGVGGHARENFTEFLAPNGAWSIEG